MKKMYVAIELEDGKLEEVMSRLRKAEEEINRCYSDLRNMGVLIIKEKELPKENDSSGKN